jgi:exopolyphosphatase/guanosine-5'-triphosphate,3'-diphosphate pyrophosphatase
VLVSDAERQSAVPEPGPAIAAIDIGSNSIKLTVARRHAGGALEELGGWSEVVRLGSGLDRTGRLAEDRIDAAVETLHRFAARARALGAVRIVAVATEATRAAANGDEFLARVLNETGIEVSTIDGNREAWVSFRGLATVVDVRGAVLIADIGGGSTELISAQDGDLLQAGSVAVGSGRLTDRHVEHDPPTADELDACRGAALALLQPLYRELRVPGDAALRLILVGGTGEYLGRMVPDQRGIRASDVDLVATRLQQSTAAELAESLDIPEARARVLPAGVAIVLALIDLASPAAIAVGQSGLRTGILMEAFDSLTPATIESGGA